MGNLKYFSLLMVAGMFAACSDNLENPGNGGENTPSATEGFVRVSINTPTTNGNMSRADDDNTYPNGDISLEDGTANEYKINDGVIVFFKSTSVDTDPDANATFVSAYDLEGLVPQGGDDHQVSEKVVTVSKAPKVDKTTEKLYALVILNKPDVVVVDAKQGLTIMDGSNDGKGKIIQTTDKFPTFTAALKNQTLSTYTGSNNDFTMCNAPLSTVDGADDVMDGAVAKTLVPVEVYPTENEALSNDAARIYVERVVAKVTLTGFTDGEKDSGKYKTYMKNVKETDGSVYNGDVVELKGWILNVTNKSTALVRNVSGFKSDGWLASATNGATNKINRFAGTSLIPMGNSLNYYRIYWAEDGNYSGSYTVANEFNTYYSGATVPGDGDWNKDTADNTTTDTDHALYCLENTMSEDKQNKEESTSVLLKTTYLTKFGKQPTLSDQDFFICGANPIKYPKENNIDAEGGGKVKDIITYVVEKANEVLETDITATELSVKGTAKPGIYDNEADGKPYSDLFNYTGSTYNEGSLTTLWNAIKSQVGDIRYYKKGESYYYAAIIRHFSDKETPWSDGEDYGIQHLGRYGVVRNNWYEININNIGGPGEPEIVEPGGPDDKAEGYIRAEINVLSWAKRSQGVDL